MGYRKLGVRIPPARVLDFPERLFPLKRFQRDEGMAGFSKERRNRYRVFFSGDTLKRFAKPENWSNFHAKHF